MINDERLNLETYYKTETEVKKILSVVKSSAELIRREANEQTKLTKLDGECGKHLITKIDELILELEEQNDLIVHTSMTSRIVFRNLEIVNEAIDDIHIFLQKSKTSRLTLSRRRITKQTILLQTQLRSKFTQLMASVSLEMLAQQEKRNKSDEIRTMEVPTDMIAIDNSESIRKNERMTMIELTYQIGCKSYFGIGTPVNYNIAFSQFMDAAKEGHLSSMTMLASCYRLGYGVDRNILLSREWLEKAVTSGCPDAMNELAMSLIAQTRSKPQELLGHIEDTTQNLLATRGVTMGLTPEQRHRHQTYLYESVDSGYGNIKVSGTEENESNSSSSNRHMKDLALQRAIRLLLKAAEQFNHAEAQCNLGLVFEETGDVTEALKWYHHAVTGGSIRATNLLGLLYFYGHDTLLVRDREHAFSLFLQAARGGSSCACCNVGMCYELGCGTSLDIFQAIEYYASGARLGSTRAMYNLGYLLVRNTLESASRCNFRGNLLTTSFANNISLDNHSPYASVNYNIDSYDKTSTLHLLGQKISEKDWFKDFSEGMQWLRKASDGGVGEAGYQLGRLYELGRGVPRDWTTAYSLYYHAAELGHCRGALCAANMLYCGVSSIASASHSVGGSSNITSPFLKKVNHSNNIYMREEVCSDSDSDSAKIKALYRQAAIGGIAEAMNALGLLLENEAFRDGFIDMTSSADLTDYLCDAARWYFTAAEQGLVEAACNLALLICRGAHILPSHLDAVIGQQGSASQVQRWLLQAVALGHPRALLFRSAAEQLNDCLRL